MNILCRTVRRAMVVISLVLSLLCVVSAQSGRRVPQTASTKPVDPVAESREASSSENLGKPSGDGKRAFHKIKLLVARQRSSKSFSSEDAIFASFVRRLNEFDGVAATSIGDLKREEVIKRSQQENDSLVLLLQFELDKFQNGSIVWNSADLKVRCLLFAPRTGQQKFSDKVYYQPIGGARARKDDWPTGTPVKMTPEAAGVAVAERLCDWLALNGFRTSVREE